MRPPWPYRLRTRLGGDGVARRRGSVVSRLLATPGGRVVVHAWQPESRRVVFRAGPADADAPAGREAIELAIERMRFALGVDEDLSEFARTFRGDPLIGEIIHHRPWHRPRRRPWPWEALAWAVTEQLIEARRAAEIQRRDRPPLGRSAAARRRRRLARTGPAARRAAAPTGSPGSPRPSSPRWTWRRRARSR